MWVMEIICLYPVDGTAKGAGILQIGVPTPVQALGPTKPFAK
jgi:hypothetical protein